MSDKVILHSNKLSKWKIIIQNNAKKFHSNHSTYLIIIFQFNFLMNSLSFK